MRKQLSRLWASIRQVLSVRSLLQWLGLWHFIPAIATAVMSGALSWWAHKSLPAPIVVVVAIASFASLAVIGAAANLMRRDSAIHPQGYSDTLHGRVIQLRDEMKKFLGDTGERPRLKREPGMTESEYQIADIREAANWQSKLEHGFALQFSDRALHLFHECGKAGTSNDMLGIRLKNPPRSKAAIEEVISDFDWLSRHV